MVELLFLSKKRIKSLSYRYPKIVPMKNITCPDVNWKHIKLWPSKGENEKTKKNHCPEGQNRSHPKGVNIPRTPHCAFILHSAFLPRISISLLQPYNQSHGVIAEKHLAVINSISSHWFSCLCLQNGEQLPASSLALFIFGHPALKNGAWVNS